MRLPGQDTEEFVLIQPYLALGRENAQTTIDLLARLERHNPDKRVIHVILDRAPVHRGKAVRGSRVLVLGVAYKKDVDDPRESPSFELMKLLLRRG